MPPKSPLALSGNWDDGHDFGVKTTASSLLVRPAESDAHAVKVWDVTEHAVYALLDHPG
jgi:hypothetical protein